MMRGKKKTVALVAGLAFIATPAAVASAAAAPVALNDVRVFTGGNDIAVVWKPANVAVDRYTVYRDGRAVADVRKQGNSAYLYDDGTRYFDRAVRPGGTYTYQVAYVTKSGRSALSKATRVTQPNVAVPKVTIDASAAPDLAPFLNAGKATIETWYPKMAVQIALPDYKPTNTMRLKVQRGAGVAYASGNQIVVDIDYARGHKDDLGMFVHEATHVLQAYPNGQPFFIQEGIADWTRYQMYADRVAVPPSGKANYASGYGDSAYFLEWVSRTYKRPELVKQLNVTARKGGSTETVFKRLTGKSSAQLGAEMKAKVRA